MVRNASDNLREVKAAIYRKHSTCSDDDRDVEDNADRSRRLHLESKPTCEGLVEKSLSGTSNDVAETEPEFNRDNSIISSSSDSSSCNTRSTVRPGAQKVPPSHGRSSARNRQSIPSPSSSRGQILLSSGRTMSLAPTRPGNASVDLRDARRAIKEKKNLWNSLQPRPSLDESSESSGPAYGFIIDVSSEDGGRLPIAVPMDGDEDKVRPAAVEFDADNKTGPAGRTSYLYFVYIPALMAMVLIGIIGTAVGFKVASKAGPPKVLYRETLGIRQNIERFVDRDELEDHSSPYSKALDWITHEDPLQMTIDHKRFFQRYFMAYLYFATTVKQPWANGCGRGLEGQDRRCKYFDLLFDARQSIRWLSDTTECLWAFVTCDSQEQVTKLEFEGKNMTGKFPGGIVNLPYLQRVVFEGNQFDGPLPDSVFGMKHLSFLSLKFNGFTGSIPNAMYTSQSLQRLHLRDEAIVGTISPSVDQLTDLKTLMLLGPSLSGTLPRELFGLTNLDSLRIQGRLNGTLPTEVGQLERLTFLQFSGNDLAGSLPTEIGRMKDLFVLLVDNNKFTGAIPSELYSLPDLAGLVLSNNQLQGTLSTALWKLNRLRVVLVENNLLTGVIPETTNATNIASLREAKFQGNFFNGSVPLCNHHFLDVLSADCGSVNAEEAVTCECCTECCVQSSGYCYETGS